jgi:hypothetical protein
VRRIRLNVARSLSDSGLILDMIDAGTTHIVLGAVLGGRPVEWLVDQIIEPVLAQTGHS